MYETKKCSQEINYKGSLTINLLMNLTPLKAGVVQFSNFIQNRQE